MKSLYVCAAALALAACAEQEPAPLGPPVANDLTAPALSAEQIKGVIVGNTGTGPMSGSHVVFTMYVASDGTALADLPTGIDHGVWRLTADGQWCVKWATYRAGEEYCQHVFANGASYKFVDRTSEEILTFTPGKHISG